MEQCVDIVDDRDFAKSRTNLIMYYMTLDMHIHKSINYMGFDSQNKGTLAEWVDHFYQSTNRGSRVILGYMLVKDGVIDLTKSGFANLIDKKSYDILYEYAISDNEVVM